MNEEAGSITPGQMIGPEQEKGADLVPSPSLEQVRQYIRASKAESTLRGYKSDWRHFCEWCDGHGVGPLPASPETVASYIAECAAYLKVGSLQRRLNAISEAHKAVALDSPTTSGMVRNTLKGIKRTLGTAAVQKTPAMSDDIRAMLGATDAGLIGLRDRALILLGFAGAFRRSEVVGLDVKDYLGRDYRIEVDETASGEIEFSRRFLVPAIHQAKRRKVLRDWYIARASEKILSRVDRFARELGVEFGAAKIVDNRYRWGSCTVKDNVNFNWRLIKAPMFVIDYVIVHELAHLIEPNHTPRFWNIVRSSTATMEKAKAWLKEHGQVLEEEL